MGKSSNLMEREKKLLEKTKNKRGFSRKYWAINFQIANEEGFKGYESRKDNFLEKFLQKDMLEVIE